MTQYNLELRTGDFVELLASEDDLALLDRAWEHTKAIVFPGKTLVITEAETGKVIREYPEDHGSEKR